MTNPNQESTAPVLGLVSSDGAEAQSARPDGSVSVVPDLHADGPALLPPSTSQALKTMGDDAERLLQYAAQAGVEVEKAVRNDILATVASDGRQSPASAARLLEASTRLAAAVWPVTAESLAACANSEQVIAAVGLYRLVAICLASIIIPISIVTFMTTSISETSLQDIEVANALAVKLSDEIGPPQAQPPGGIRVNPEKLPHGVQELDVIQNLQTFAATSRAIDAKARQLDWFLADMIEDPFKEIRHKRAEFSHRFELPSDLPDLSLALTEQIATYQEVRYFAQSVRELISTVYGAIAVGILPVLYALLGACAYLLRVHQEQVRNRTFTLGDTHVARFVTAAIGGGVVGLFKNFNPGDGASISPLAIAFLVGYAADVFFSFLDAFVQAFNKGTGAGGRDGDAAKRARSGAPNR